MIELSLRPDPSCTEAAGLLVEFFGPDQRPPHIIRAFWDGGAAWRVRFAPDAPGPWEWRVPATGESGRFDHVPEPAPANSLAARGPLRLSADRRHLVHADGTPFFWLADTAWNGVLRASEADWERYLATRAVQGFTVIQFVASHWRGNPRDAHNETACDDTPFRINPAFFQRLDAKIAMINRAGLVAAPVALWSLLESDPGFALPEDHARQLAQYILARYDAFIVVWLLGGDGSYEKIGFDRWRRLGRDAFDTGHARPATLHPCGQSWVADEFRSEPWFQLAAYQSGHGDADADLRWLVAGPPASAWRTDPVLPVLNLEPNYETTFGYSHHTPFTDFHVRRASYWSLLLAPPAGVTYGHDAIWNWNKETGPSVGHPGWHRDAVPPWHTGLETPGIRSMSALRSLFETLPWWTYEPAQHLLPSQPGDQDVAAYVACARAPSGSVILYSPTPQPVALSTSDLPGPIRFIDPATGSTFARLLELPPDRVLRPTCEADWIALAGDLEIRR